MFYIVTAAIWAVMAMIGTIIGRNYVIPVIFMVMSLIFWYIDDTKKEIFKVIKEKNND